jgi:hypothetical protein
MLNYDRKWKRAVKNGHEEDTENLAWVQRVVTTAHNGIK